MSPILLIFPGTSCVQALQSVSASTAFFIQIPGNDDRRQNNTRPGTNHRTNDQEQTNLNKDGGLQYRNPQSTRDLSSDPEYAESSELISSTITQTSSRMSSSSTTSNTNDAATRPPDTNDARADSNDATNKKEEKPANPTSQIVSWGTTTGKLYLSGARLDEPTPGRVVGKGVGLGGRKGDGGKEGAGGKGGEEDVGNLGGAGVMMA